MKRISLIFSLFCAVATSFAANYQVKVSEVAVVPGKTVNVTVSLESDEAIEDKAISFDATPSENLSIVKNSWTLGEDVSCFLPGITVNSKGTLAVGLVKTSVPEGTTELVTFSVAADEAFAGGELKFSRVKVAGVNIDDFTVEVSDVVLGLPEFNIDDEYYSGKVGMGDLEANGLFLAFPESKNITPDMQIKVVASLSTMVPGYGNTGDGDDVDPGYTTPEYQVVLPDVEFFGDAMFGAPEVQLYDFLQYIAEAGAGVYGITVSSVQLVNAEGDVLAELDEEAGIATMFEVTVPYVVEATAVVGETEADEWGDQHYTVTVTVENSDNELTAAGVSYAYTEGVKFTSWNEEEATEETFTFNCISIEGVEVVEDEDVILVCKDAVVSRTTDSTYEGEIRAEGLYPASCIVALADADYNEIGYAEFIGELELKKDITTGITNVKFNVTDAIYNINGQRANANAKGIVIKNGVKMINK